MTKKKTILSMIEVSVNSPLAENTLHLTIAGSRKMADVMRASAARFHILDDEAGFAHLQLRKDGCEQAINLNHPAAETINPGDKLIVEPVGELQLAPPTGPKQGHSSVEEATRFTAVVSEAVRDSLSGDSATFTHQMRQGSSGE